MDPERWQKMERIFHRPIRAGARPLWTNPAALYRNTRTHAARSVETCIAFRSRKLFYSTSTCASRSVHDDASTLSFYR